MVRAQHHIPPKMYCCILRLKPTNFMGPRYHFFWGQRQMASNYNIVEQNIHGRWTSDRWSLITGQIWLHLTAVHPSLDAMYIAFKPWNKTKRIQGPWALLGMFRSESKKDGCQETETAWTDELAIMMVQVWRVWPVWPSVWFSEFAKLCKIWPRPFLPVLRPNGVTSVEEPVQKSFSAPSQSVRRVGCRHVDICGLKTPRITGLLYKRFHTRPWCDREVGRTSAVYDDIVE